MHERTQMDELFRLAFGDRNGDKQYYFRSPNSISNQINTFENAKKVILILILRVFILFAS